MYVHVHVCAFIGRDTYIVHVHYKELMRACSPHALLTLPRPSPSGLGISEAHVRPTTNPFFQGRLLNVLFLSGILLPYYRAQLCLGELECLHACNAVGKKCKKSVCVLTLHVHNVYTCP